MDAKPGEVGATIHRSANISCKHSITKGLVAENAELSPCTCTTTQSIQQCGSGPITCSHQVVDKIGTTLRKRPQQTQVTCTRIPKLHRHVYVTIRGGKTAPHEREYWISLVGLTTHRRDEELLRCVNQQNTTKHDPEQTCSRLLGGGA